jgi:methionyl aminopeptidase
VAVGAGRVRWRSYRLRTGITFALEPMVSLGRPDTKVLDDHWTVVSRTDRCAEHTIAITPEGRR